MVILLKIAILLIFLLVIPFFMGLLPAYLMPKESRTPGVVFLSGYFVNFALFELIGIPVVIFSVYHSFSRLTYLFLAAALLLVLAAVILICKNRQKKECFPAAAEGHAFFGFPALSLEEKLGYLLFFLLLGFQMYMAFTRASFDGDDAYYGAQGAIAQQLDSLYRFDAYTGRSAPLDVRHALALIPVWEAFIGRMSDIHVTVIAHSVVPILFLALTYLLYFQIGKKLLADQKDMLPMFMILIALFQMFGNVSIYTNETFLLTRTWQGKSIAGNLILPAVFWIYLCLFDKERKQEGGKGYWILLACINLAAGVSSSLAVLLSAALVAGLAVLVALKERKFSILVKAGLTCIPSALYVLTYLIISR